MVDTPLGCIVGDVYADGDGDGKGDGKGDGYGDDLGKVVDGGELEDGGTAVEEGANDEPVEGRGVVHLEPRLTKTTIHLFCHL